MVTMDRLEQQMREAQQTQEGEAELLEPVEQFDLTVVPPSGASEMVTIYHRETGEPRRLPRLAAEIALRKRYRRGDPLHNQFVFSARPTKPYHYGQEHCWLHPDGAQRRQYDEWGLPTCSAASLASPGVVRQHMESRHPSAFKVIREEEQEQRRRDDMERQEALARAILQAAGGSGAHTAPVAEAATPSRRAAVPKKPKAKRKSTRRGGQGG